MELRGPILGPLAGMRVQAAGKNATCAEPLEGTTQVINATEAKQVAGPACADVSARFLAAHPNISIERRTKKKCKVVAGVLLGGAAAGGITAAVCCKEDKTPVSVQ